MSRKAIKMTIRFDCKRCGFSLKAEEKTAGRKAKCPSCGRIGVVPEQSDKIRFHCESCGQKISVSQIYAGHKGKCPKCSHPVVVPIMQDGLDKEHQIPGSKAQEEHPPDETICCIEIENTDCRVVRYASVEEVRNDLFKGKITRHNRARKVYPEPKMLNFPLENYSNRQEQTLAYDQSHRKWEKQSTWRPIGSCMAEEDDAITLLYNPRRVYMKKAGAAGTRICAILVFMFAICLLIYFIVANWGTVLDKRATLPPTPGSVGGGQLLRILASTPFGSALLKITVGVPLAILFALAVGLTAGHPVGAIIGYIRYRRVRETLPYPPPDGYNDRSDSNARLEVLEPVTLVIFVVLILMTTLCVIIAMFPLGFLSAIAAWLSLFFGIMGIISFIYFVLNVYRRFLTENNVH